MNILHFGCPLGANKYKEQVMFLLVMNWIGMPFIFKFVTEQFIICMMNHESLTCNSGGGKALTMTMTPWNLPHGQWSKKLTMTMTPSILPMVNGQIDQF